MSSINCSLCLWASHHEAAWRLWRKLSHSHSNRLNPGIHYTGFWVFLGVFLVNIMSRILIGLSCSAQRRCCTEWDVAALLFRFRQLNRWGKMRAREAILHILSECNLSYAACNAHTPKSTAFCDLSGCTIFFLHSHKRHNCRKKTLNLKCVFWFCLQLLAETFLIVRRIQRDIVITYTIVFM